MLNNNWNIIKCRPCGILRELIKSSGRAGNGWVEHNWPSVLYGCLCAHVCGIWILDWVSESAETTYIKYNEFIPLYDPQLWWDIQLG